MSDLRRALALYESKQYAIALPLFHAALRRSELKPGGASSAETADILDNIGRCYFAQSIFRAAAEHCRRAAAISDYAIADRICASLGAAAAFCNAHDYAEVEQQLKLSLSMLDAESVAGTTAPEVLKRLRANALALSAKALREAGRYSEALPPLEENLVYYESIGDTQNLTECVSDLGEIYFTQGLSEKALAMARRARSLNPNTAASLRKLGSLLSRLDLNLEALECSKTALECEERESGKNTYRYVSLQEQIGTVYDYLGQFDVALSWYHRARSGFEKQGRTTSLNFGELLANTGVVYERKKFLPEALAHYTRAEAIYRGVLPPDHPTIVQCMRNISRVNSKLGNIDAAASAAAAAASTARRSQVQCAAADCPRKVKADGSPLDQCGGCKRCYYCSVACQTTDWKAGHKAECKALRDGK